MEDEVRDFKWSPGMQRTEPREKNSRLGVVECADDSGLLVKILGSVIGFRAGNPLD